MRAKDKRIVDAYMNKHRNNLNPRKLEEYAKKKGIHINAMDAIEHRTLRNKLLEDLNLPTNLDMEKEENQIKMQYAIDNLSPEKRTEYMKQVE